MKHRKKIDDIYRERLRDVETPPPADSWEYISSRLPAEKKSRILPLWIKLAGTAAALVLLVTLFNLNDFEGQQINESPVTNQQQEESSEPDNTATAFEEAEEDASASEAGSREASGTDSAKTGAAVDTRTAEVSPGPENASEAGAPVSTSPEQERTEQMLVSEERVKVPETTTDAGEITSEGEALAGVTENIQHTEAKPLTEPSNPFVDETTEDTKERASFLKRFRISTTAAAVYSDNLGRGNTLDNDFSEAGSGEVSMSYGINLAYQISEKIKIRSGVNKVNLNYNMQNVDYASAMQSEAVDQDPAAFGTVLSSAPGSIAQELGFIEVPMEVEYALVNRKIGINLIGGASTLFLDNNRLSLNSSGFSTDLGEAQNLNSVSFSANIGLGLQYNLSPQFQLNLEPIFKYQLNTFNDLSNLKPYYFGIYSGLSFGF